jgi:hypothetical protein
MLPILFCGVLDLRVCFVFVVVIVVSQAGLYCIRFSVVCFIVLFLFVLISLLLDMCLTDLVDTCLKRTLY